MEKVIIVLFIFAIITSLIASITDSIHTHYQKRYNKLLEEQNELLFKNLQIDTEILLKIKKSEEKTHE